MSSNLPPNEQPNAQQVENVEGEVVVTQNIVNRKLPSGPASSINIQWPADYVPQQLLLLVLQMRLPPALAAVAAVRWHISKASLQAIAINSPVFL